VRDLRRQPLSSAVAAAFWLLIVQVLCIGGASLLFHVRQTRISRALDLLATAQFMLTFAILAALALGYTIEHIDRHFRHPISPPPPHASPESDQRWRCSDSGNFAVASGGIAPLGTRKDPGQPDRASLETVSGNA
jgi:hypothetical protein